MTNSHWESIESAGEKQGQLMQAMATPFQNFVVQTDFEDIIGNYLRMESPFWTSLIKVAAKGDVVKEAVVNSLPAVSFTNKLDLASGAVQPPGNRRGFDDPGQQVKAIVGFLNYSHYARSLVTQQGNPYGDAIAEDTQAILVSACQLVEESLFTGNATTNPLSFNGLINQIPANTTDYQNSTVLDLTDLNADRLSLALPQQIARIMSRTNPKVTIDEVWTSGSGISQIETEWSAARINLSEVENVLGTKTLGIRGPKGIIPVNSSAWIRDRRPAGVEYDEVDFWFIDKEQFVWEGIYPYMGAQSFEPQLMDVSSIGPNNQPMTDKRMLVMYGTPFAKNRGRSIHRLTVRCRRGLAWNIAA